MRYLYTLDARNSVPVLIFFYQICVYLMYTSHNGPGSKAMCVHERNTKRIISNMKPFFSFYLFTSYGYLSKIRLGSLASWLMYGSYLSLILKLQTP